MGVMGKRRKSVWACRRVGRVGLRFQRRSRDSR